MIPWLAGSTWGVPIVAALHVLAIAWFGGAVIPVEITRPLRRARWIGFGMLVTTGVVLFLTQPERYFASNAFRIKMVLLALLAVRLRSRVFTMILLAAMILAARAVAYF